MQAQILGQWRAAPSAVLRRSLAPRMSSSGVARPGNAGLVPFQCRAEGSQCTPSGLNAVRTPAAQTSRVERVVSVAAFSSVGLAASLEGHTGVASAAEVGLVPLQTLNPAIGEVSAVLEAGVLLLYLGGLLSLLAFGTFLVVRQVLVRRELENAAKELQERVRSGQASSEEYFELGAVMLRKKFYTLSNKYLLQAIQKWEGDEQELAQVHNALGFSYFSEEKFDKAVAEYEKAVKLQPAYVTAWNNMGDALEKKKEWAKALKAYESGLMYDPSNRVANERRDDLKRKVAQLTF